MLTDEQKFQVRYYLGFPDLSSLPDPETTDSDEIYLLQKSKELEVRMDNLSAPAEAKVIELLGQLDQSMVDMTSISGRLPFKRIEDITFRDDELDIRWENASSLINALANILGIEIGKPIGPTVIGLAAV